MHHKFLQRQIRKYHLFLYFKERNISPMSLQIFLHNTDSLSPYFYLKIPLRFSKKM